MVVKNMTERRSVKQFLDKDISLEMIEGLVEVGRMTPSSMGIQVTRLLVIPREKITKEMKKFTSNQEQIHTCSHVVVLLTKKVKDKMNHTKCYMENAKEKVDIQIADGSINLEISEKILNSNRKFMENLTKEQLFSWAENQTYIVLGTMVTACAEMEIDCCPIEGFSKKDWENITQNYYKGYEPSVLLTVGYKNPTHWLLSQPKVRIESDKFVKTL